MVMLVIMALMITVIALGRKTRQIRARHYLILLLLVMLQVAAMVVDLMTKGLPPPIPQ